MVWDATSWVPVWHALQTKPQQKATESPVKGTTLQERSQCDLRLRRRPARSQQTHLAVRPHSVCLVVLQQHEGSQAVQGSQQHALGILCLYAGLVGQHLQDLIHGHGLAGCGQGPQATGAHLHVVAGFRQLLADCSRRVRRTAPPHLF